MKELDYNEFWKWEYDSINNYAGKPILRIFKFPIKTVSFGRHLDINDVIKETYDLNPNYYVKRLTGGGWVFHEDDVCLSVIFKTNKKLHQIYNILNNVVYKSLKIKSIDNNAFGVYKKETKTKDCFQNITEFDIVKNGIKIIGSAIAKIKGVYIYQCCIKNHDIINICLGDLEL
ncbi:MAG: hypothetical protein NZ870_04620 [bacterium]|nr:hypothetical protein [bacterium]